MDVSGLKSGSGDFNKHVFFSLATAKKVADTAAAHVTVRPILITLWSTVFAIVSAVGGIVLSLGPGLPISPYVTTVSFVLYLICRGIGAVRRRHGWARREPLGSAHADR